MTIARGLVVTFLFLHAVLCSAAMRVAGEAELPSAPRAVAVDPVARKAFLAVPGADPRSGTIAVIELDSLAVREIGIAAGAMQVLADAAQGRLYVMHMLPVDAAGLLTVIDTSAESPVAELPIGLNPTGMAANFARNELYVTNKALWVVDTARPSVAAKILVGPSPAGVAVDRVRGRLIVGSHQSGVGRFAVVDLDKRSVLSTRHGSADCFRSSAYPENPDLPVVDERSAMGFLQRGSGDIDLLDGPDYELAASVQECGATDYALYYVADQAMFSAAFGRLYQIGSPLGIFTEDLYAPFFTLRSIDSRSGVITRGALPNDAVDWRRTLVVDDDGGDLYATTSRASRLLFRVDPETLAVRETLDIPDFVAELSFRDPLSGRIFLAGTSMDGRARLIAVETAGEKAGTRLATGFRHKAFDHHLVTADPIERRLIDDGRFGSDWQVTDDVFRVWSQPAAGSVPVCRFFSARFAPKSSHFFTPYAAECDALKQNGDWQFEGIAFHVALPDAAGACPAGTEPLYRLYNEGSSGAPNHRYTTSTTTVSSMTATGWSAEGVGPGRVFACTPTLR